MPIERACRDFRSKFPDDVLQENLAGQLWFGAEVGYQISSCDLSMELTQFCLAVPGSGFKYLK
jgi:hypothetical protein